MSSSHTFPKNQSLSKLQRRFQEVGLVKILIQDGWLVEHAQLKRLKGRIEHVQKIV